MKDKKTLTVGQRIAKWIGICVGALAAFLAVVVLALHLFTPLVFHGFFGGVKTFSPVTHWNTALSGKGGGVIGGFTLVWTHPFASGDFVEIAGQSGTVQEIGMAYTKLITPDNKLISIPNSAVVAAQIVNYTALGLRRVDINVADLANTEKLVAVLKLNNANTWETKGAVVAPGFEATFKYNEISGKHIAEIGSNPYDISLKLVTALTIKGNARVCTSTYEYYETDITYVTKSKTMSDSNTASGIYGGNSVTLIDRDALAAKMTSSYEMSNVMEYCCNPGDGENSDQIWWQSFKKERAYYYIVEETLKIDITGEKVTGVTLRIKNNIGAMTLNGKSNSSGTTNINL